MECRPLCRVMMGLLWQVGWHVPVHATNNTQSLLPQQWVFVCGPAPQAESSKLEQVFKEFDLDGSGQLDRREMQRLIARLMPDLESR